MRERAFGNVRDWEEGQAPPYFRWLAHDAILPECEQCGILPLCVGGCPRRSLEEGRPQCLMDKAALEEQLRLVTRDLASETS